MPKIATFGYTAYLKQDKVQNGPWDILFSETKDD